MSWQATAPEAVWVFFLGGGGGKERVVEVEGRRRDKGNDGGRKREWGQPLRVLFSLLKTSRCLSSLRESKGDGEFLSKQQREKESGGPRGVFKQSKE